MENRTYNNYTPWLGLGVMALAACATTTPRELVDARAAYHNAQMGQAAQFKPDLLHEAKMALNAAEKSFADDSDATPDLAYIAMRKAQLAQAAAGAAAAEAQGKRAQAEGQQVQGQMLANKEGQLARSQQDLAVEKQARFDADKKAKDAMDKLAMALAVPLKEEPRGTVITLPGNIFFASGKSELLPTAQGKLFEVADALRDEGDRQILIEGHTDSRGTESSNMALSQRRADAVRQLLVSRGVLADNVRAVGIGSGRPAADNKTSEGRANNRRVEIIIQSEMSQSPQGPAPQLQTTR